VNHWRMQVASARGLVITREHSKTA
jgi:hypothetical protein